MNATDHLEQLQNLIEDENDAATVTAAIGDALDSGELDEDDERLLTLLEWLREQGGDDYGPEDLKAASYDERSILVNPHHVKGGTSRRTNDGEYQVLTDAEADQAWDDSLESLLDDEGIVPGADSPYFDRDKWKEDAKTDGRAHSLGSYDGCEHEQREYYIYRVN